MINADVFVRPSSTLRQAMEAIDRNSMQICFVLDEAQTLVGVLTDGDIRRALLKGAQLDQPVSLFMGKSPKFVTDELSRSEIIEKIRAWNVRQLPVVNRQGRVVRIETADGLMGMIRRPNQVVLMAGGFGKRLSPLTDTIPKPLLKIGGRPILETIIRRFRDYGFYRFTLIVNYRADMIKECFGQGKALGVEIDYIQEDKPLGTCGGISLFAQKPSEPIFVMNGDILTRADFGAIMDEHIATGASATMAVREHYTEVPYGVVKVEDNKILKIEEKPRELSFVNAGIYVLSPEALDLIPRNQSYDMPSLFMNLKEKNQAIRSYKLKEYWMDIGRLEDYHKAQSEYEGYFGS